MNLNMKKNKTFFKKIISEKLVKAYYSIKPEIHSANIYILKNAPLIENLSPIDKKFTIRQITKNDTENLKKFYANYKHVLPRLETTAWVGLAAIDSTNGNIAYISWVVKENIQFLIDLNIIMSKNQFMVRHGFCNPKYRHQGLHTRMEEERINWCIRNGATDLWVHIATKNKRGIQTLLDAGYVYLFKKKIIRIPLFGVHRELFSFLKSPFKKVL